MSTILITGVAGFIGFHLAKKLLGDTVDNKYSHQIIGLDNLNHYYDVTLKEKRLSIINKQSNFKFMKGDISDPDVVNAIFLEFRPEIVIHLAAQAGVRYSIENPQAYMDSNITGFFHMIEACRRFPVKHFLFASSSSVYGNQKKTPFSTSDFVDEPISFYAATKKSNELMAYSYSHLYHIPMTGLRFFTVYGPYGRPDMAYFSFADKIMREEPIQVYNHGDLYRDFTYIDDVVKGICCIIEKDFSKAMEKIPYKIYNIGNTKPEKLLHFIKILENKLGKTAKKEFLPMQNGDVYTTYADISEMEQDFGFFPKVSLDEGIGHFVDWYQLYVAE